MSSSGLSEEDARSFLTYLGKDYARLFRSEEEALRSAADLFLNDNSKRKPKPVENYLNDAMAGDGNHWKTRKSTKKYRHEVPIDRVIAHDGNVSNPEILEFRVRWRGFSDEHDEWFYYEDLKGTPALHKYLAECPELKSLLPPRRVNHPKPKPLRGKRKRTVATTLPSRATADEEKDQQAIRRRKLELEKLLLQKELELLELEEEP